MNSLTKFAASDGDSILGLVVVNPAAPDAAELRARLEKHSWKNVGRRWCDLLEREIAARRVGRVAA